MVLSADLVHACFDELEKIAIASTRLRLAQSRGGRRPMRVATLLKKEKEGTLYKRNTVDS